MGTSSANPVNFAEKSRLLDEYWSPRVIAEPNDYKFKLVKLQGEFACHSHTDTDEAFIVLAGAMAIDLPDCTVELKEGEIYVVPQGVAHKPRAAETCRVLLVEPRGVVNTGDTGGELTADNDHRD